MIFHDRLPEYVLKNTEPFLHYIYMHIYYRSGKKNHLNCPLDSRSGQKTMAPSGVLKLYCVNAGVDMDLQTNIYCTSPAVL